MIAIGYTNTFRGRSATAKTSAKMQTNWSHSETPPAGLVGQYQKEQGPLTPVIVVLEGVGFA